MLNVVTKNDHGSAWMLPATIARLKAAGVPWVVENVPSASVTMDGWYFTLCGSMFGLRVRRHRRFGASFLVLPPPCQHAAQGPVIDVTGHGMQGREYNRRKDLGLAMDTQEDRREAMKIDWMNRGELAQAIPPAYTRFIGEHLHAGFTL